MHGCISNSITYNREKNGKKMKMKAKHLMFHKYGRILDWSNSIQIKTHC